MNNAMRIDSKGKYYTKIVTTEPLEIVARVASGELVEGSVHIPQDRRLSDVLNEETPFLSLTSVTVRGAEAVHYEVGYLAVRRTAIQWVLPASAIGDRDSH